MKYVTFNIRTDVIEDGINCFDGRKQLVKEKILSEKPDLIGFQEVMPHVAKWLKENLEEYTILGCGREADLSGEQMTIAFHKSRFNLIQMETYWMSETPFQAGSRYEHQSLCPRTCTEVVLFDEVSNRVIRMINTHLDHIDSEARMLGLTQILKKTRENKLFHDAPILLSGDFNASPESEEMAVFKAYPEFTNQTVNIGTTFHGYGLYPEESIDFVFTKGDFKKKSVTKWTDEKDGIFLSDHYPVCVVFED